MWTDCIPSRGTKSRYDSKNWHPQFWAAVQSEVLNTGDRLRQNNVIYNIESTQNGNITDISV